ncbi:hypothetical protein BC834DRAFT_840624 [Gloeopeniophorella convolvens]|nr:hypothetical protein BC834DRAFT_840624 [Gloeopeniophorella convolvens]
MATPDPPPNSLGLDLANPEPVVETKGPMPPSAPSPQLTQPTVTTSTPTTSTTITDTTKPDEDARPGAAKKKSPYVNPERVKTGGAPRDKLTDEELAERMARIKEQNEKIKQRRLDVEADEDAFKQTQAAERLRQVKMRKVQETVDRTREQNARRKMDKIQSREWDSEKKADGWPISSKHDQRISTTVVPSASTQAGEGTTDTSETSPPSKQREDAGRGRGVGGRGRSRGRGRGEARDKALRWEPYEVEEKVEKTDRADESTATKNEKGEPPSAHLDAGGSPQL